MLSPFLKEIFSGYNERRYQIALGEHAEILNANAQFEEVERLDMRALEVSQRRISLALSASKIIVLKRERSWIYAVAPVLLREP